MLEKLQNKLAKVEKQLEKVRGCSPITHGWQTQKYSRADKNWDYYAQQRMKLLEEIEKLETADYEENTRMEYYCSACGAMLKEECCCE